MGSSTEPDATRAGSRRLRVLALALAAALSACGGNDEREQAAGLAAVRILPGNPPTFALVTLNENGFAERVVIESRKAAGAKLLRLSSPAWSPDARWINFTGVVEERDTDEFTYYVTDIFAVRPDGSDLRRLTDTGNASAAVPSPDGRTLLFARSEHQAEFPPTSGLWLMESDGSGQRRLLEVRDGWIDLPGSWSPDGGTIAFTRCRWVPPGPSGRTPNTCAVRTVSKSGSKLKQLAERASSPAYSPEGERIAFRTDRDEHGLHRTGSDEEDFANELYVMRADGRNPVRLTRTESLDEEGPAWSPDGNRIAYAREGPASFARQLMVANDDGSCATRIAGDAASTDIRAPHYEQPAWRPGKITGRRPALACEGGG